MSRFITALCILALFLAGSTTSLLITKRRCDVMLGSLVELRQLCEEKDEGAYGRSVTLLGEWDDYRVDCNMLVHSQKLMDIQTEISRIPSLISEDSDDALATIDSVSSNIRWIYNSEIPNFSNVF